MVITISREYAAYGRSVAKGLSEALGIEYYDVDVIRRTAKVSGYSEEDVTREGEYISNSRQFINQFLGTSQYNSSYDAIFEAQREVLLEFAKKDCIIVGRCSNIILREAGVETFDIFLHAPKPFRIRRCEELGDYGKMNPEKYLDRCDHWRETYYHAYTGHTMGNYNDYDISLNVEKLTPQGTIDTLVGILKDKVNKA